MISTARVIAAPAGRTAGTARRSAASGSGTSPPTRPEPPPGPVVPYAELHCHSSYSFLDGASSPEQLVEEAVRLGLSALAVTDHDGFYGSVRFAEAAQEYPALSTVHGAELSLGLTTPQQGIADPEGSHLLVLAAGVEGYHRLAGAITEAQLRGDEKGRPEYHLEELAAQGRGHWYVLTGCRKGLVRQALAAGGAEAAGLALRRLAALFGSDAVAVELTDHGQPGDGVVNDALAALAAEAGLPTVATNNVHFARPADRRLAQAVAAVRARRSLAELDGWLPASGSAFLHSGAEMVRRFERYPGAVERSVEIAHDVAFDLRKASPRLPKQQVPPGHTPMTWLRELVRRGADELYASNRRPAEERLQRELAVIEEKDFPGYFLIVHDIVAFARSQGILCQGRGSAANSAVCYALKITAVDSIAYDLPFERFLSATRDEEPDIDVDFDSDRREEVIQWVYETYGRRNAAQVANVISYQPKSAVRDMAKALGYSVGQQDAWSKSIESWHTISPDAERPVPAAVVDLANDLLKAPRHLGIHSGGMVLTERPVGEVVPIERGRMEGRTVLQWDKDDCAWMGLVKFDLLGLGMLGAIQHTFDLVAEHCGEPWTLATIPKEEAGVYDMLCRADSIGVFQVESRAQIGTLPRLKPRRFYDLVIEIALIRPGPIQGGAVHPYIRRATGREPVTYQHPALEPVLRRTLGVPLFQEQLMQIAMAVGGCSGDDADLLRRAMGSKRGIERIERLRETLYAGMAGHGITGDLADDIYDRIQAFANFGFAESHAISFGLIVYASSWLKLHYPGAFLAALLRSQPMGFYSPQSLTADARRHGVKTLRPDVVHSGVHADLETGSGRPHRSRRVPRRRTAADPAVRPARPRPHRVAPARRGLRRTARAHRGAGHRRDRRATRRRRAGRGPVHRHARRRTAKRPVRRPDGGTGHGGGVRRVRHQPPPGTVERRLHRCPRPPRRHRRAGAAADAAGHERGRADAGRPLGHPHLARRAPHGAPAAADGVRGRALGGRHRRPRGSAPGAGRRPGDPSPAPVHRRGSDLPEPRGRDRHAERRRLRRGVAAAPPGRAQRRRPGDPRDARAPGRRGQPRGRPDRAHRDALPRRRTRRTRASALSRLPLSLVRGPRSPQADRGRRPRVIDVGAELHRS